VRRRMAPLLAAAPMLALALEPEVPPARPPPAPAEQPAPPPPPSAPEPFRRGAWYVGFGLGWGDGSVTGASGTSTFGEVLRGHRPVNLSLAFRVGVTLGATLLLGVDVRAVRAAGSAGGSGSAIQVNGYDAMLTFFPWERGLFVRAGMGFADLVADAAAGSTHHGGLDLAAGAGYAFWLGQSFNLSLNLGVSGQWYGGDGVSSPRQSRVVDVSLGFDWY